MDIDSKKIFLTGGTGFLGSFLVPELLKQGHELYLCVRVRNGEDPQRRLQDHFARIGLMPTLIGKIHSVQGDVTQSMCGISKELLDEMKGSIKEVWHLAGLVKFRNQSALQSINIDGVRNVIELAKYWNAHLHHISTAYVAGNTSKREILEKVESISPIFRNFYEETKYQGERLVVDVCKKNGIRFTIYRPTILSGDSKTGQAMSFTGFYVPVHFFYNLWNFLKCLPLSRYIPIFIPYYKYATLNLIPVDAAARIIAMLSLRPEISGRVFHVVHPNPPLVRFVFEAGLREIGYKNIFFVSLPLWCFKMVQQILWVGSFCFGKMGKRFRRQILDYFTYLMGTYKFSYANTKDFLQEEFFVPSITVEYLKCCIQYAIQENFGKQQS